MKSLRITLIALVVLIAGAAMAFAHNQFRSWNHSTNSALLSISERQSVDVGLVSADVSVGNSSVAIGEIFQQRWIIDLNAVADDLGSNDWEFGTTSDATHFATFHFGRVGVGYYTSASHIIHLTLPNSLFETVSEGLPHNDDGGPIERSGEGEAALASFAEAGLYGSYRHADHLFAVKAGAYVPLFYGEDVAFAYDLYMGEEPNDDGNVIDFRGRLDGAVLTSVNLDDPSDFDFGVKTDIGVVRRDERRRAMYGLGVNNIPIVPARARFRVADDVSISVTSEGALQALIDGEEPFEIEMFDLDDALAVERLDEPATVYPETSVSGFYRFDIPIVDVVPHAEYVFGRFARLNGGLVIEGDLPVLRWFSFGVERRDFSWRSSAALRIPLRAVELTTTVGLSAPELRNMFNVHGLAASVALSVGW